MVRIARRVGPHRNPLQESPCPAASTLMIALAAGRMPQENPWWRINVFSQPLVRLEVC